MKTGIAIRITLAAVLLLLAGTASAQSTTGQVTGRVLDAETGRPIAGATVTASSPSWIDQSVTTDSNGWYVIGLLPPATYTVAVKAAGYGAPLPRNVQVMIDWRIRSDQLLLSEKAASAVPRERVAQNR
jgi:hypothetical protein